MLASEVLLEATFYYVSYLVVDDDEHADRSA